MANLYTPPNYPSLSQLAACQNGGSAQISGAIARKVAVGGSFTVDQAMEWAPGARGSKGTYNDHLKSLVRGRYLGKHEDGYKRLK